MKVFSTLTQSKLNFFAIAATAVAFSIWAIVGSLSIIEITLALAVAVLPLLLVTLLGQRLATSEPKGENDSLNQALMQGLYAEFGADKTLLFANEGFETSVLGPLGISSNIANLQDILDRRRQTAGSDDPAEQVAIPEAALSVTIPVEIDGQNHDICGTLFPVMDDEDAISKYILSGQKTLSVANESTEITPEASESESLLAAIMNSQAVIIFDPSGKILSANSSFERVMGYSETEIVGKHHSTFAPSGVADTQEYRDMWKSLGGGAQLSGIFHRVNKKGADVYLEGSYSPVVDESGRVQKVIKIVTDVTDSQQSLIKTQQESAELEEKLSDVVKRLSEALLHLAEGDLTTRIDAPFDPAYEELRGCFNTSLQGLETTISSIIRNSKVIRDESRQMSNAADELSKRTENQAASLEQSAAALAELTRSVKSSSEIANSANASFVSMKDSAEASGQIVEKTVRAMSEIESSSTQIFNIIGAIENIAFQTNLLALNAGVEAARAGDAGRGFAVVASEVQALATRSSDAAQEIKQLIDVSDQHVKAGVELVGETGNALSSIVKSVAEVSDLVKKIADFSSEQSVGLSEINTAINQLDQVTQQNAAMVEETTAASHNMTSEAESLMQLSHNFRHQGAPAAGEIQEQKTDEELLRTANAPDQFAIPTDQSEQDCEGLLTDWREF